MTDVPPVKVATHAAESGHWYSRDAKQVEEVEGKRPDFKNKLVIKYDLAPGVTSVMRQQAAPGLVLWQNKQWGKAGRDVPMLPGESEDAWLKRVGERAGEIAAKAADAGTDIHAALKEFYRVGTITPGYEKFIASVRQVLGAMDPDATWTPERVVVSPLGYGTAIDLYSDKWLIDFKGTVDPLHELKIYPRHHQQLQAGRQALMWMERDSYGTPPPPGRRTAIVYIHRDECWAHAIESKGQAAIDGMETFRCCLRMWQIEKHYAPTWATEKP